MFNNTIFRHKIILSTLILTSLLGWSAAQAGMMMVENNSTVTADISASDATRISVTGDRITLIRGTKNAYTISNDNTQGAIFIKPILPATDSECKKSNKTRPKICSRPAKPVKPFYLFISTEQKHNYVLQLTPKRHQAASLLVLKPLEAEQAAALTWEKSEPYSQILIRLTATLLHQQIPPGNVYEITPTNPY